MIPLSKLVHRDSFGCWLQENRFRGTGVEVGTYYGSLAHLLTGQWTAGDLVTVDPYDWDKDPAYVDGCRRDWQASGKAELDPEVVYQAAKAKLAERTNCRMLRMRSVEAAATFKDKSLTFVLLGGNHAREAVRADVKAWLPKVASGGIFCGHDFYNRSDELMDGGVFDAIWEFAHEKGWKPHVTQCTSWWFVVP